MLCSETCRSNCDVAPRYDRLREHAVSYLSQNYTNPSVQGRMPDTIDRLVLGDLPHAGGILRSLLGLRVAVAPPPPVSPILTREAQLDENRPAPAPSLGADPDPLSPSDINPSSPVASPRISSPHPPVPSPSPSAANRPALATDVTARLPAGNAAARPAQRPSPWDSTAQSSLARGTSEPSMFNVRSSAWGSAPRQLRLSPAWGTISSSPVGGTAHNAGVVGNADTSQSTVTRRV